MRICILGHAGVGKSPFSKLFKIPGWEPFRIRDPRNEEDKKVCKTKEEYQILLEGQQSKKHIYKGKVGAKDKITIYDEWSFFTVREKPQCLQHTKEAKNPSVSLRIEIFAPILVEMIENIDIVNTAFHLSKDDLVVIILNPTPDSFFKMSTPSQSLCLSTHTAVAERNKAQGKPTDLPDILSRVCHLDEELKAWSKLIEIVSRNTIECCEWQHFEYRYLTPCQCLSNAQVELIRARQTFMKAVKEQTPHLQSVFMDLIRTESEIITLSSIV